MANSETYSRTSYFPVIPDKVKEFHKWTRTIASEGNQETLEHREGKGVEFCLLDVDSLQCYDEEEGEYYDGWEYLVENFLAPGGAVTFAYGVREKMRYVGGGAQLACKELTGKIHWRVMDSRTWLCEQRESFKSTGFDIELPES